MAGTGGCSRQFEKLKLSDTCGSKSGSDESGYVTAPASEFHGANTTLSYLSARCESMMESERSGECSASSGRIEEQIERSKAHWSTLADQAGSVEGEECSVEESNFHEFLALQSHPIWGEFFTTFGYDTEIRERDGEMEVGEKFAEGGQAELFHVRVTWWNPKYNEEDLREGKEFVLKVFKKGTFLKHLKSQLPHGLLQFRAEGIRNMQGAASRPIPLYCSRIHRGILLKDGRFAFLMHKEDLDLWSLIEHNINSRSGEDCGPFSKEEAELMMYQVALGVNWLHSREIVHRDLKASNVLVCDLKIDLKTGCLKWCFVADYECSIGVVGTGFFRAPEILQVCLEKTISQKPEVFSKAADSYSYGMTCYEILTGKHPFQDHPLANNNPLLTTLVINQHLRPKVHEYVEDWIQDLLKRCWQFDIASRPTFGEILDLLSHNSVIVKESEDILKVVFGKNYRTGFDSER